MKISIPGTNVDMIENENHHVDLYINGIWLDMFTSKDAAIYAINTYRGFYQEKGVIYSKSRLRFIARKTRTNSIGQHVIFFGIKCGY